jgi:hypothetical protein
VPSPISFAYFYLLDATPTKVTHQSRDAINLYYILVVLLFIMLEAFSTFKDGFEKIQKKIRSGVFSEQYFWECLARKKILN